MEKRYATCPGCLSPNKKIFAHEQLKNQKYEISECNDCHLVYTSFQSDDTNEYYGESMEAWTDKYSEVASGKRRHDRHFNYLEEVGLIQKYVPTGNHLDIGCNAGWLLGYLQKNTPLNLYGLEPSPVLSEIAKNRLQVQVFNNYVKEDILPKNFFDSVSMTDVFEHVPNPNEVLRIINGSLKPSGKIFVKVPNGTFTKLKYYFRHILKPFMNNEDLFNAKEHLIHFDLKNIYRIFEKNGFRLKQVLVPLPIQTRGSSKISLLGRQLIYRLAKLKLLPAQDLFIIAEKI